MKILKFCNSTIILQNRNLESLYKINSGIPHKRDSYILSLKFFSNNNQKQSLNAVLSEKRDLLGALRCSLQCIRKPKALK